MPPAKGVVPLWTPRLRGLRFNYRAYHPPDPFPEREGKVRRRSGGHSQTPAKGVAPLWTPHLRGLRAVAARPAARKLRASGE